MILARLFAFVNGSALFSRRVMAVLKGGGKPYSC